MDEAPKTFAPELSPAGSRKWIARLVIAVLVGVGIWNLVVSFTVDVVLPALARVMEADSQSPLYLGKGDFNLAPLFAAVLELCFALIAAILVNSWSQQVPRPARRKAARTVPAPAPSLSPPTSWPSAQPISPPPIPTPTPLAAQPVSPRQPDLKPASVTGEPPPKPAAPQPVMQAPAPSAKTEKPPKPKKVYYNIVGERVEEDDE
jgi:hypothetical protein